MTRMGVCSVRSDMAGERDNEETPEGEVGRHCRGWTGRIEGGDGRNWERNHRIE